MYFYGCEIKIIKGDITRQATSAIVNAANSALIGGGGVDGAIHKAAGDELPTALRKIGSCPTGTACITEGFRLKSKYIIHTVGPIYHGGNDNEAELLKSAYVSSLALANDHYLHSISFPAISTGVYRFPKQQAARIAISTTLKYLKEKNKSLKEIVFVLFDEEQYQLYVDLLNELKEQVK
jgi:O-acetyl-ADP-ribose deacetylase (regulator of RNase III)